MFGQALKVFLCDVGGVMIPFDNDKSVKWLAKLTGRPDIDPNKVAELFTSPTWIGYGTGRVSDGEFCDFVRDFLWLPEAVTDREIKEAISKAFEPPSTDMLALLEELREEGIPTVAVTNIEPVRERFLFHLGLLFHTDGIVRSYRVGALKPDPAMYEKALELARVPADCVVFVDDTLANVKAAEAMGIRSFHYTGDVLALREFLVDCGFLPRR